MLRSKKTKFSRKRKKQFIDITIREEVLSSVFDECDKYDLDETGGRVLGVYSFAQNGDLKIDVTGVIEPGPATTRSSTSLYQDGNYQAKIFRKIEREIPEIEHLGNWHTHHVNGFPTLSGGDIETYTRIVNHEKHNLSFFYALLVTSRNPGGTGLDRYNVRHYVLFRNDSNVYEVDESNLSTTVEPAVWPRNSELRSSNKDIDKPEGQVIDNLAIRAKDKEIVSLLYPQFQPYLSTKSDTFFWKGEVRLLNDADATVMIPELANEQDDQGVIYQPIVKSVEGLPDAFLEDLSDLEFRSASEAIQSVERTLNSALFAALKTG